jgi:hypothetical protein
MTVPAITSLEAAELPVVKIVVKNGEKTDEYQLVLDYNAIAKISDKLGKDLSKHENWFGLSGSDLSIVAWGALDRFHADIDLRTVRQWFSPPMFVRLYAMLLEAAYPGILEAIDAAQKEQDKAKQLGESQPNLPAEAVA